MDADLDRFYHEQLDLGPPVAPTRQRLLPALQAAVAWLGSEQHQHAVIGNQGIRCILPVARGVSLSLQVDKRPTSCTALVILWHGWIRPSLCERRSPPAEVAAAHRFNQRLVALVASVAPVVESWEHTHGASARLGVTVGPDLVNAVDRYDRGCPRHHGALCWATSNDAERCRWLDRGLDRLVLPAGWR